MLQGLAQPLQLDLGPHQQLEHRHLPRRGEHVVGGLAAVDMVVGVDQGVVPLLAPQQLNGPVGDDLIGVHVQAGARAPLDGVHNKGVVELAVHNLPAGLDNGAGHPFVQQSDLVVGDGRGHFDLRDGVDNLRVHAQPRDGKVLRRPQGLHPVVDVLGHRPLPHQIMLRPILFRSHASPPFAINLSSALKLYAKYSILQVFLQNIFPAIHILALWQICDILFGPICFIL